MWNNVPNWLQNNMAAKTTKPQELNVSIKDCFTIIFGHYTFQQLCAQTMPKVVMITSYY